MVKCIIPRTTIIQVNYSQLLSKLSHTFFFRNNALKQFRPCNHKSLFYKAPLVYLYCLHYHNMPRIIYLVQGRSEVFLYRRIFCRGKAIFLAIRPDACVIDLRFWEEKDLFNGYSYYPTYFVWPIII